MIHARLPHEFQPNIHTQSLRYSSLAPSVIGGITMLGIESQSLFVTTTFGEVKPPDYEYYGGPYVHGGDGVAIDEGLMSLLIFNAQKQYVDYNWWSLIKKQVGVDSPVIDAITSAPSEVATLTCAELPLVKYSFYNCTDEPFDAEFLSNIERAFLQNFKLFSADWYVNAELEFVFVINPYDLSPKRTYSPSHRKRLVVIGSNDFDVMIDNSLPKGSNAIGLETEPKLIVHQEPYGDRLWGLAHPFLVHVGAVDE